MISICFKPHPLLQNYIKCYSFLEGYFEHLKIKPIADGYTIEAGIVATPNIRAKYLSIKELIDFHSYIGGILHNVEYVQFSGYAKYVGIVMFPYTIRYLFNEEPEILKNEHIDFIDFFGEKGKLLIEQILISESYFQKTKILNSFFMKLLKNKRDVDYRSRLLFNKSVCELSYNKTIDLCNYLNTTPRTLQRYFKDIIGINPQLFLKIYNINKIINDLHVNSDLSVHDIIYSYCYYDQSHLNSDIKKYTGFTLKQLLEYARRKVLPYSRNLFIEDLCC
jgi:AraC-like DNA-binding protein